jgi:hypothetical protein
MMKTRLSAHAAAPAKRVAPARIAGIIRIIYRKLKMEKMKNVAVASHGRRAGAISRRNEAFVGHSLDAVPPAVSWYLDERFPRHLWHLPRDYELAIRWLRPSFLTREHWTPGQQCPGSRIRMHVPQGFANGSTPPGNTIVVPLLDLTFLIEFATRGQELQIDRTYRNGIPWNCAFTIP